MQNLWISARFPIVVALAMAAILVAAATFGVINAAPSERVVDGLAEGVYLLKSEGPGRKVELTDGSEAILGERLSPSVGVGGTLQSHTNDNTRFTVKINKLGPLPPEVANEQLALVVEGLVFHLGRAEKLSADGIENTWTNVYSADAAQVLAARYKIEPQLRTNPGHKYEIRWVPAKPRYEVGEAVTLRMELKNTGTGPLRFTFGGKQRGPRNNQFRFVAQASPDGKGLPDTGDPTNFGGIVISKTLGLGETFTAEVDLSKWFTFSEPNAYRVTGVLELPIIDPTSPDEFRPVVWDDLAVAECVVRVEGQQIGHE